MCMFLLMSDAIYLPSRIVETAYGKVEGRRLINEGDRQVDAFQGIPFAAPPIGELRFKKPQTPACWKGLKETKKFAARCIQEPLDSQDYDLRGIPSEDSLYLNVFTPCWEAPEQGFPVMAFLHGGGFVMGETSSYGDIGICENIVSRGIVFITIQYRLGYVGFLSTGDGSCPGNFGLWDQIEALKWIQLNIGAFAGDQSNVTLLGQSAGGASVDLLHLSPHSTNLFHKAVTMAGTAECRWALPPQLPIESIRKACKASVGEFTDNEEMIAKLRLLPAVEIAEIFKMVKEEKVVYDNVETGPCLDGDLFPESLDALRAKATPKPFITGVTKEEGLLMMTGPRGIPEGLEETLSYVTKDCSRQAEMKVEVRNRFIGDIQPDDPAHIRAQAGMISDAIFIMGTLEHCRKTVEMQTEPMFLYVFDHYNPSIMGELAAGMPIQDSTHTCELFYLFKKGLFGNPELTETEQRVMDIYSTAISNFAKYGDPNGSNDVNSDLPIRWNPITRENPPQNYVITSDQPKMSNDLFEGRTAAFIDIRNRHK